MVSGVGVASAAEISVGVSTAGGVFDDATVGAGVSETARVGVSTGGTGVDTLGAAGAMATSAPAHANAANAKLATTKSIRFRAEVNMSHQPQGSVVRRAQRTPAHQWPGC